MWISATWDAYKREAPMGDLTLRAERYAGRWTAMVTRGGETLWVSDETYEHPEAAQTAAEAKGARLRNRVVGMPRRRR
jgi:hypothetical protein